jgi:uncharacterized protein YaeQ
MALKATVYKVQLNIADMDRGYYADHALTLACHPSETEERLMVRILTFALYASADLQFTRGLSSEDEPDLWQKDLTGAIVHWIELGLLDESRIRKGAHRAERVTVVTYGERAPHIWWEKIRGSLARFDNLTVLHLPATATAALVPELSRSMQMQVSVQDGSLWVSVNQAQVEVRPERWR